MATRPYFKKKEPLTIMKIKPPIRKHITPVGHIPPIRKHDTLAPRRSPTLKWNIKKR